MDVNALLAKIQSAQANIDARKTSGINAIRPPAGETRWRILPGWRAADRETFFHYYGKHWIKDADGKVVVTYLCERDTYGRACVICDSVSEAIRSTKDDKVLGLLKELTSRRGVLVNAVQIAGPQADPTKPVLLDIPPSLFDLTFIPLLASRMSDDIVLLDMKEGRDVIIKREGTGLSTRYTLTDAAKSTAMDPALLTKLVDIDAWLANEKSRGDVKGVTPLNEQLRRSLGGTSFVPSASLVSATPPASVTASATAALAPPNRVLEAADAVEIEQIVAAEMPEPAPVAAKAVARPKPAPTPAAAVHEDDLDKLLAELN